MAEFCLECFNEIFDENYTERDVLITQDLSLCEGCSSYKKVVICEHRFPKLYDLRKKLFSKKA